MLEPDLCNCVKIKTIEATTPPQRPHKWSKPCAFKSSAFLTQSLTRNYGSPGGYLVYLSDGDVPFFRVSFSPIFSRTGYQKKANFLEQVVKTCRKRKFCCNGLLLSQIFVFLSILFTDFF